MISQDEEARARAYLLTLLKHRPRSRREATMRLQQKGFSRDLIESLIQQAESKGWLNDALFARLWVEDRVMRKPKSRRALVRELQTKGIEREQVERALARVEIDEERLAEQLARERLARYQSDDPNARARKLAGFLRRRGFSGDVIRRIMKKIL